MLATAWDEFQNLDLEKLRGVMTHPVIIVGRNLFDADQVVGAGFAYHPTGRPSARPKNPNA